MLGGGGGAIRYLTTKLGGAIISDRNNCNRNEWLKTTTGFYRPLEVIAYFASESDNFSRAVKNM